MAEVIGAATYQPRPTPTLEQRRAADPGTSAWVTASAGTGKTRVLTDRVLRLLLAGTDPERILCLTFTKAAAAEMVGRVQGDLGRFAILPAADLADDLERLLGRPPAEDELERARRLFAQVLDLSAGLPIMTIHGFCQALLRRFPLEAEVVPHFDVIEPRAAADLLRAAQETVLVSGCPALQAAVRRLAVLLGEASLGEALRELAESRLRLWPLIERHGDIENLIEAIDTALDLPAGATIESLRTAACSDPTIDHAALGLACRALETGSKTDRERAAVMAAWLGADLEDRQKSYADYEQVFLTSTDRAPKKSLATKNIAADPEVCAALSAEQDRLVRAADQQKAAAIAERTAALLRVGWAMIDAYQAQKARRAVLDYDDLIERTCHLLHQPGISPWVHYKLDQRIDHLLVDEGQDTSPHQWTIIEALVEEYFSGEGTHATPPTLFVVGDEKQSIFSFQGADLETFHELRQKLGGSARSGRAAWREEPLSQSYRSTEAVLTAVDAVFDDAEARDGVIIDPEPLRHQCTRRGEPGEVEVWPLIEAEPARKPEPWRLPDQEEPVDQPERRLAQQIADRIRSWQLDRTPLPSKQRPIQPGDIMILLPRRGILQDLIVRYLKQYRIPVAGADRLALTDALVVKDLMALGDALLLPEDDLTLAAVLKSPLFGLDEEELFELAYERGEATLFQRLTEMRGAKAVFAEAHERFRALLAQVDFLPPFEFYARLLGEDLGKKRFLTRLGHAAIEPIEAFLAQALAYEQGHPPSLQGFLHWLRADATELVRDPDRPKDEVRVLTVHGAKGLEAPIVFLADTTTIPKLQDALLWRRSDGLPLWRGSGNTRDPVTERAQHDARQRQLQEQRRLLYVAMTRARDRLIVTGWHKQGKETTWYDLISRGMTRLPGAEETTEAGGKGWRFTNCPALQQELPFGQASPPPVQDDQPSPAWLDPPPPPASAPMSALRPSHGEPAAVSPAATDTARYQRGRLIHSLLQSLPDTPIEDRDRAMARYLARPSFSLSDEQQAEIGAEVRRVLTASEFAEVFAPGSRAEVPLTGVVAGQVAAGQVDRLAVSAQEILVIDYKTEREPPASPADMPLVYWRQMAVYRALLQRIYPGRTVRCALLWTNGPRLMALDEATLENHLEQLGTS